MPMTSGLLILPILIPLVTAVGCLLGRRWRGVQRVLGVVGAVALLAASVGLLREVWVHGIQAAQMGNWPAPFGITLVADTFSAVMVLVAAIIHFAVTIYSLGTMDMRREAYGFYTLLNILLMGVCGAFLTGDLFNLYVWFEVLLIASFVLMALGGERAQMEGAFKYVTLNLLSSALFLAALGILYGAVGTLNLADLSQRMPQVASPGVITTIAMLFLVAFGIKAATFPLFFWLPASYHTPPVAVSAVFAGLLTKVGVYALIRVFTLLFVHDTGYTHTLILWISALTMMTGVLGAVCKNEVRQILSYNIVSHIGYMTMGLGLLSPLGIAGAIFYAFHHIVVMTNLFFISGVIHRLRDTFDLDKLGGLYRVYPVFSILFLIPALSLAGVPPLSGFFAKLALIQGGLAVGENLVVGVALMVSLLTLISVMRIWSEAFWKEPEGEPAAGNPPLRNVWLLTLPIMLLAAITLTIGLMPEPFFEVATRAAEQLLDPREYIDTVLRGRP